MFGIRLGEHHELDIGGIASELIESAHEIIDLVRGQREAPLDIGAGERLGAVGSEGDHAQRPGRCLAEQIGFQVVDPERVGHPIMQQRAERLELLVAEGG